MYIKSRFNTSLQVVTKNVNFPLLCLNHSPTARGSTLHSRLNLTCKHLYNIRVKIKDNVILINLKHYYLAGDDFYIK